MPATGLQGFNCRLQSAIIVGVNEPTRGKAMHVKHNVILAPALLMLVIFAGGAQAQTIQQTVTDISLKNGESTELGDLYFITTNCKSLLKSTPEVEIVDGPPGVTAAVNAAKVVPRGWSCANPVAGGKLVLAAKDIEDYSFTRLVLRINYNTLNGPRQRTWNVNVALFPSN
jgi:hypothetical protein